MKLSSCELSTRRNSFPTNFSENPQEIDTSRERNSPAREMKFVAHNFPQKPIKNWHFPQTKFVMPQLGVAVLMKFQNVSYKTFDIHIHKNLYAKCSNIFMNYSTSMFQFKTQTRIQKKRGFVNVVDASMNNCKNICRALQHRVALHGYFHLESEVTRKLSVKLFSRQMLHLRKKP